MEISKPVSPSGMTDKKGRPYGKDRPVIPGKKQDKEPPDESRQEIDRYSPEEYQSQDREHSPKRGENMPLYPSGSLDEMKDRATKLCKELGHFYLGCEHYVLAGLKEGWLVNVLNVPGRYEEKILELCPPRLEAANWEGIPTTPRLKRHMKKAEEQAVEDKAYNIEPRHLLAAIFKDHNSVPSRALIEVGGDTGKAVSSLMGMKSDKAGPEKRIEKDKKTKTPHLDRYARNLVELAREGKVDPVIGRNDEIRRVLQTLTRKTKNNPVLIGEAGVGKTAVVYGLALRLASGEVPEAMKNKVLLELNMSGILAGAKHRGEFEERLQDVMKEVKKTPEIILFIDEIHTIAGAGDSRGGMDAGNILKPALSRGEFPCIGATTTNEYRKYIEKDPALERRFQPVLVNEPSEAEAFEILKGIKDRYEKHHGVTFTEKALLAAVKLSVRFLPDRNLPDKAIDLIDEAAARVKTHSLGVDKPAAESEAPSFQVDEEQVAEVVSLWTGIPVAQLTQEESERLLAVEDYLEERVLGQGESIKAVAETIRMARMGLTSPSRPSGVFLFLGPTGVGKTELAKALAEFLFGSEKDMIRLDMSEFMDKHTIYRLVGSPPGYVGHEEEGQLTRLVRTKPYSVVLLDEVEKAHPEVFDLFLQVFDDGRLTDGKGRTVNFANTVIIMTSNLGTSQVDENGNIRLLDTRDPKVREEIMKVLRQNFRPEFLNRIDEILVFNPLGMDVLSQIISLHLEKLKELIADKDIELKIDESVVLLLEKEGYDPAYGARPLNRAIQNYIAKPLASALIAERPEPGETLVAVADGETVKFIPGRLFGPAGETTHGEGMVPPPSETIPGSPKDGD